MGTSCRDCIFCSIASSLLLFAVQITTESLFLSGHRADHWIVWEGSWCQKGTSKFMEIKAYFCTLSMLIGISRTFQSC